MNNFLNNSKVILIIISECLLNLITFVFNIVIINIISESFKFKEIYLDNLIYILLVLIAKSLLIISIFYIKYKKEVLHGIFKKNIRKKYLKSIFTKKSIGDLTHTGELSVDLWIGVEWMGAYYFDALPSLISKLILLFCIISYIFFINSSISLLLIFTIIIIFLVEKRFDSLISKTGIEENRINEEYSKMTMEALKGTETLKSLNAIMSFNSKLKKKAKELKKSSMKFVYLTCLSQCIKDIFIIVSKLVSLVLLIKYFINKSITITLICIIFYTLFVFYNNIVLLQGSFLKMSKSKVYKDKIKKYIESSKDYNKKNKKLEVNNNIGYEVFIKNLNYKYPQTEKNVLKNINLKIKKTSKVALIGPSGSGKSTILKCLSGFLNDFQGNVCVGGLDILNSDNMKEIKKNMSIIWQKNHIFNTSVIENLKISKKEATQEEVISALKKANIYDFINSLPEGLYTKLGKDGFELSGGQQSRIAIARAFLRDTSIILLDEPTRSLDRENELKIMKNIEELVKDKTIIQTAHRLETIKNFDKICYIENGEIKYSGTHQELLKLSKEYNSYFKKLQDIKDEIQDEK